MIMVKRNQHGLKWEQTACESLSFVVPTILPDLHLQWTLLLYNNVTLPPSDRQES